MTGWRPRAGRCSRSPSRARGCSPGTCCGHCRSRRSVAIAACSWPCSRCRDCSSSTSSRRCWNQSHERDTPPARCESLDVAARMGAPARARAPRIGQPAPGREHDLDSARRVPGGGDRQRPGGAARQRKPPPTRRPAYVAHGHRPRLRQHLNRAGHQGVHHPRCRVRKRQSRRARLAQSDLPDRDRAGARGGARGRGRLLPAGLPLQSEDGALLVLWQRHDRRVVRLGERAARLTADRAKGRTPMTEVATAAAAEEPLPRPVQPRGVPDWWPLGAILLLAAILRLSTLGQQSFWYDEAFTPVHVLRASLAATLHNVVHTENTPPLWYVLEWAIARVLGTGVLALRLLSALAGIATVAVAWAIARELATRRTAIVCATLVAVNPLFVWYSQEA